MKRKFNKRNYGKKSYRRTFKGGKGKFHKRGAPKRINSISISRGGIRL